MVLDTNVLVSAFFWDGNERSVLQDSIHGGHSLPSSPFILDEMAGVLDDKFEVPAGKAAWFLGLLAAGSEVVEPEPTVEVIGADPSDNRIPEAALEAGADALVSGDSHPLGLGTYEGIHILPAAEIPPP